MWNDRREREREKQYYLGDKKREKLNWDQILRQTECILSEKKNPKSNAYCDACVDNGNIYDNNHYCCPSSTNQSKGEKYSTNNNNSDNDDDDDDGHWSAINAINDFVLELFQS